MNIPGVSNVPFKGVYRVEKIKYHDDLLDEITIRLLLTQGPYRNCLDKDDKAVFEVGDKTYYHVKDDLDERFVSLIREPLKAIKMNPEILNDPNIRVIRG